MPLNSFAIRLLQTLKKNKKLLFVPLVLFWLCLFIGTSLPGKYLPNLGISDKLEHFSAYFVLTAFLIFVGVIQDRFIIYKKYTFSISLLFAAFYGAFDELHQLFIPDRVCDFNDWLADFTGAIAACIVVFIIFGKAISHFKKQV